MKCEERLHQTYNFSKVPVGSWGGRLPYQGYNDPVNTFTDKKIHVRKNSFGFMMPARKNQLANDPRYRKNYNYTINTDYEKNRYGRDMVGMCIFKLEPNAYCGWQNTQATVIDDWVPRPHTQEGDGHNPVAAGGRGNLPPNTLPQPMTYYDMVQEGQLGSQSNVNTVVAGGSMRLWNVGNNHIYDKTVFSPQISDIFRIVQYPQPTNRLYPLNRKVQPIEAMGLNVPTAMIDATGHQYEKVKQLALLIDDTLRWSIPTYQEKIIGNDLNLPDTGYIKRVPVLDADGHTFTGGPWGTGIEQGLYNGKDIYTLVPLLGDYKGRTATQNLNDLGLTNNNMGKFVYTQINAGMRPGYFTSNEAVKHITSVVPAGAANFALPQPSPVWADESINSLTLRKKNRHIIEGIDSNLKFSTSDPRGVKIRFRIFRVKSDVDPESDVMTPLQLYEISEHIGAEFKTGAFQTVVDKYIVIPPTNRARLRFKSCNFKKALNYKVTNTKKEHIYTDDGTVEGEDKYHKVLTPNWHAQYSEKQGGHPGLLSNDVAHYRLKSSGQYDATSLAKGLWGPTQVKAARFMGGKRKTMFDSTEFDKYFNQLFVVITYETMGTAQAELTRSMKTPLYRQIGVQMGSTQGDFQMNANKTFMMGDKTFQVHQYGGSNDAALTMPANFGVRSDTMGPLFRWTGKAQQIAVGDNKLEVGADTPNYGIALGTVSLTQSNECITGEYLRGSRNNQIEDQSVPQGQGQQYTINDDLEINTLEIDPATGIPWAVGHANHGKTIQHKLAHYDAPQATHGLPPQATPPVGASETVHHAPGAPANVTGESKHLPVAATIDPNIPWSALADTNLPDVLHGFRPCSNFKHLDKARLWQDNQLGGTEVSIHGTLRMVYLTERAVKMGEPGVFPQVPNPFPSVLGHPFIVSGTDPMQHWATNDPTVTTDSEKKYAQMPDVQAEDEPMVA